MELHGGCAYDKLYTVECTNEKGKSYVAQTTIPQLLQNFTESMADCIDAIHELTDAVNENTAASDPEDFDDDEEPAPARRKRK